MLEPYNAINISMSRTRTRTRTNRIRNDVAKKQHGGKKKPRPTLNFRTEDDTIYFGARMEEKLNVDNHEVETIDRKAHDESREGHTNHTEEYNQKPEVEPESKVSEDDATLNSEVIDNIAAGFTHLHVLSLENEDDEEESASVSECEWEIMPEESASASASESDCECDFEWEVMSGVQSVQSFRENECMFTYKDAVQVQMQTNQNSPSPGSFPKVNTFHKVTNIKIPPLASRTFPTTTTKAVEEKEDGYNAKFDAYFEYDGFKGGRGGKSFKKQNRNSCITTKKGWYTGSRFGQCKKGRGGKPFR